MSIKIRQLETEKDQTDLKLKRLIAAVKVDRDAKEQELLKVKNERELAEKKADELESMFNKKKERKARKKENKTERNNFRQKDR